MAWTKVKTALVAGAVTVLVTGTATIVVVRSVSHPIRSSANPSTVQVSLNPSEMGPEVRNGPHGPGPDHLASRLNPNARFANLTPQQRVEQARRRFPESVEDLKK